MRYTARITPIFIIFISVISPVYANTSVDVSNTGIRTQTNVNVQGDSHITVESNTSSSSKTDIEVTVNGETKKITSDKNENISYQSDDGSVKIEVQNNTNPSNSTVSIQPTKKPESTPAEKQAKDLKEQEVFVADVEVTNLFSDTISFLISIIQSWI